MVGENILEVFLAVRTVVGENVLDVRILEKMTNRFLRKPYKRPGILSDGVIIRTNPGTFGWIPQKVVGHFLAVRTVVGENILEGLLAVRTVVGANILGVR